MYNFEISKDKLDKSYTGINTVSLGLAAGQLKLCGLKLFLYLAGNKDGFKWTLNPTAYAGWLGISYEGSSARAVRKAINDGIADLVEHNYLTKIDENTYRFSEHFVPKLVEKEIKCDNKEEKKEQIVPKNADFVF